MLAQFFERDSCGVFAFAAVRAIEILVVDVCEGRGLEFGVFHGPTLARVGCGLLLYKSYRLGAERVLYKVDAAATRHLDAKAGFALVEYGAGRQATKLPNTVFLPLRYWMDVRR
jgi:hypothetical protein